MSLAKRLAEETRRVKTGRARKARPSAAGFHVSVDVDVARVDNLLQAFPIQLRRKVLRQAVRAAGRVVVDEARRNLKTHRSKFTGTAKNQTVPVRKQREGRPGDLWQSIAVKMLRERANSTKVVAIVGPRRPHGNHGTLIEFGANVRLWGRDQWVAQKPRPFLRNAADTTRRAQSNAAANKVKAEWHKI